MFQSKQLSQKQKRRQIIRQSLFDKENIQKYWHLQKQLSIASQKQADSINLEIPQQQYNHRLTIKQKTFCLYNRQRKAQFICCNRRCAKHAIMCAEQICKCAQDHYRCNFIVIQLFLGRILSKILEPLPQQIQLYFQVKSVIFEHMVNRISQERQALMDWQQDFDTQSQKSLFLYGLNNKQQIVCHAPKIVYDQKLSQYHQKCHCIPIKMKPMDQQNDKKEIIKKINKKYSSMINYFDQKIDKLQYYKECSNLNPHQFSLVDFLQYENQTYAKEFKHQEFSLNKYLEGVKIVPGNTIYQARQCRKRQYKNIVFEKFKLRNLIKIWQLYSEKIFRMFVEGKAMYSLFSSMKSDQISQPVQQIIIYIEKILQSLNQGQKQLFSQGIHKKAKYLTNIDPKSLKDELKKYENREYDELYITNDRYQTAVNEIETIKQLGNLRNLIKLEIKWCCQMKAQVSMDMLNAMPQLKHLALLGHRQKLSQNFMKKLCQVKQLQFFCVSYYSHPEHYRSYCEDKNFIKLPSLKFDNLISIKELLELSKLQNIQNVEVFLPNNDEALEVLKNMKKLKYLTLGYNQGNNYQANQNLTKEICNLRELRALSLIGVQIGIKEVKHIIANNSYLSTIIIKNQFHQMIDNETVQCMGNLIRLQTLCIYNSQLITGQHLSKLDSLIMLQLIHCEKISKQQVKEALKNMHKLQHLNLTWNQWLDQEVMIIVGSCKQLTFLNIADTVVSGEGLKHLGELTSLRTLNCCQNNFQINDLIELTKQLSGITRLSILHQITVQDNDLLKLSQNCQSITHLVIMNCKISKHGLLCFKQLKVIYTDGLNEYDRHCLAEKGIRHS